MEQTDGFFRSSISVMGLWAISGFFRLPIVKSVQGNPDSGWPSTGGQRSPRLARSWSGDNHTGSWVWLTKESYIHIKLTRVIDFPSFEKLQHDVLYKLLFEKKTGIMTLVGSSMRLPFPIVRAFTETRLLQKLKFLSILEWILWKWSVTHRA